MTTVLLVDDQSLIRVGLRLVLEAHDILVCGEADDGAAAVQLAAALSPDVVVMDVRMPGMDGIEATRHIVRSGGGARVLLLTTFDLDTYAYAGLRAGASGFLLKDATPDELVAAVVAVDSGDAVIAPTTTRRLLTALAEHIPDPDRTHDTGSDVLLSQLTPRERDIFLEVSTGQTNSEIAAVLGLSETTVKTHVGRMFAKLGLRDRMQAIILAYDLGLAEPNRAHGKRPTRGNSE